jgi:hypothetical protein
LLDTSQSTFSCVYPINFSGIFTDLGAGASISIIFISIFGWSLILKPECWAKNFGSRSPNGLGSAACPYLPLKKEALVYGRERRHCHVWKTKGSREPKTVFEVL